MRIIKLDENTKQDILTNLLKRNPDNYGTYQEAVNEVIANVKENGDRALCEYAYKFDKASLNEDSLLVTKEEIDEAYEKLNDSELIEIMRRVMKNIEVYHEKQKQQSWFETKPDGSILGQKITPMEKVGVYVPGGKASYPSSVLMNVVPAKVAGC